MVASVEALSPRARKTITRYLHQGHPSVNMLVSSRAWVRTSTGSTGKQRRRIWKAARLTSTRQRRWCASMCVESTQTVSRSASISINLHLHSKSLCCFGCSTSCK